MAAATAAAARPALATAAVLGLKLDAPLFWVDWFWAEVDPLELEVLAELELELEPVLDEAGADEELLPEEPEEPETEPEPEPEEEPVVAEEPLAAADPLELRHEVSWPARIETVPE